MIRPARNDESESLTHISFKSKAYWDYPEQFFDVWRNELTITQKYISDNDVFVLEENGFPIGFYSIVELKNGIEISGIKINKGYWLDHMFVLPEFIGNGFGKRMFEHLKNYCRNKNIIDLGILADPNAKSFYEKMGCNYQREYPSTIKNRTTPFLKFWVNEL